MASGRRADDGGAVTWEAFSALLSAAAAEAWSATAALADGCGAYAVLITVSRCRLTPMKPALKAPGTKRLKLYYDYLLASFAFNFNLCRYITGLFIVEVTHCCLLNLALLGLVGFALIVPLPSNPRDERNSPRWRALLGFALANLAGEVFRTGTRPTLSSSSCFARLYEHSH
jgi:hypothetical protein